MKRSIIISLVLLASVATKAQVSIGGKQSVEGISTILDFNSDADGNKVQGTGANSQGIILPAVGSAPVSLPSANNGTFIFDTSDMKVKMYEKGEWQPLSNEGDISNLKSNYSDETISRDQGAIIGSETSLAKGVLVLESSNKAMILPRISNPHKAVEGPYPGMICYDTISKSLAIFDGKVWNFWK